MSQKQKVIDITLELAKSENVPLEQVRSNPTLKERVVNMVYEAFKAGVISVKGNKDDGELLKYSHSLVSNTWLKDAQINPGQERLRVRKIK